MLWSVPQNGWCVLQVVCKLVRHTHVGRAEALSTFSCALPSRCSAASLMHSQCRKGVANLLLQSCWCRADQVVSVVHHLAAMYSWCAAGMHSCFSSCSTVQSDMLRYATVANSQPLWLGPEAWYRQDAFGCCLYQGQCTERTKCLHCRQRSMKHGFGKASLVQSLTWNMLCNFVRLHMQQHFARSKLPLGGVAGSCV